MIAGVTLERDRLRRTTAPHLLCERARSTPDLVVFRSKHFGIFRERSWRAYAMLVAHAARALQNLGVGRGERVAIMGDVCEEWMICDLAASRSAPSPTAFIQQLLQRKSNIRCATAGRVCLSRKTRNTSTKSCRLPIDCPICRQ